LQKNYHLRKVKDVTDAVVTFFGRLNYVMRSCLHLAFICMA
jgi:hypothetical protein